MRYTNVPLSVICNLSYFSFCFNEWLLIATKNPRVILTSDQQSYSFQVKIFSTEEAIIFSWGYFTVGGEDVKCIVHTSIGSTLYTTVWFPNSVDEENNWLPCLGQNKPYLKTVNYMYSTSEPAKRIIVYCVWRSRMYNWCPETEQLEFFKEKSVRDAWHLYFVSWLGDILKKGHKPELFVSFKNIWHFLIFLYQISPHLSDWLNNLPLC